MRSLLVAALLCTLAGTAEALPRFAARNGAPCALCHVNPSGGGLRTAYGRAVFERQRLSSPWLSRKLGEAGTGMTVDPRVGSNVVLGADLRFAYLLTDGPLGPPITDSLFLMQGDVYIGADLSPHTTLYLDQGVWGGFEAFALFHYRLREPERAPAGGEGMAKEPKVYGYLKLGRFIPAYGLRLETHSTFTRETLGFTAAYRDTGAELGVYLGPFFLQATYLQGALSDRDPEGTWFGRVEWLRGGPRLKLVVGASTSWTDKAPSVNPAIAVRLDEMDGVREFRSGVHAALSYGRFTWLGELDQVWNESRARPQSARAVVAYQELSFLPAQGLDLIVSHEYTDPDYELQSGIVQRYGASVELYPWDFVELKVMYRWTSAPDGHPLDDVRDWMGFVHLFF